MISACFVSLLAYTQAVMYRTVDECLTVRAEQRAEDIYYTGEFSHDGWTEYVKPCGYRIAGENLARGFNRVDKMFEALMDSPSHRKNIENEKFGKIGVGCYENVCVQFFKN